jgi:hypothetical protein
MIRDVSPLSITHVCRQLHAETKTLPFERCPFTESAFRFSISSAIQLRNETKILLILQCLLTAFAKNSVNFLECLDPAPIRHVTRVVALQAEVALNRHEDPALAKSRKFSRQKAQGKMYRST